MRAATSRLFMGVLIAGSLAVVPAHAERNWDYSVGGSVGQAFTGNTMDGYQTYDSMAFGAKLSAWHLPRKYDWQPQVGVELDLTRFVPTLQPQTAVTPSGVRKITLNGAAVNLLFRYPIGATPDMPQGRWHPYFGAGIGVQRARLHETSTNNSDVTAAPMFQGLFGAKFFLLKNLSVFGEGKWTRSTQTFSYQGAAGVPAGYEERYNLSVTTVMGGVAIHF